MTGKKIHTRTPRRVQLIAAFAAAELLQALSLAGHAALLTHVADQTTLFTTSGSAGVRLMRDGYYSAGDGGTPPSSWTGTIAFYPYPVGDGEAIPTGGASFTQLHGITDTATPFGWNTNTPLGGNSGAPQSLVNATTYIGTGGCNSTTAFGCALIAPRAGHVSGFGCSLSAGGGNVTCTVYLNGSATSRGCTITSPNTSCTDSAAANTVAVSAGGFISVKVTGDAGAPSSAIVDWSAGFGM